MSRTNTMNDKRLFRWRGTTMTGWRQSAQVNCIVLLIFSTALVILVIIVLARSSLNPWFFFEDDCEGGKVDAYNLALHLLINISSTLVYVTRSPISILSLCTAKLASSNFFMQVLNAPTRQEVDNAHAKSSWLGIGIPSVRNVFHVSPFKAWCWISLLLSSIPIHLLFNSAIFQVDHRESDFHLTIATEQFLRGGDFYLPGSSLVVPGLWSSNPDFMRFGHFLYSNRLGYGYPVPTSDFADHGSLVFSNVSTTATQAASWENLTNTECRTEYQSCKGLKKRRDVVLVVNKPGGWVRNDIWHLNESEARFWDQYIPSAKPNHLFFDAQCSMTAQDPDSQGGSIFCDNNCSGALHVGFNSLNVPDPSITDDWKYNFIWGESLVIINGSQAVTDYQWDNVKPGSDWTYSRDGTMTSGLQQDALDLDISYCLAKRMDNKCEIALSPSLLLGVTICVILKTVTAIIVTIKLHRPEHKPLVTLGDAMASFIEHPDPVTAGICTADLKQFRASNSYLLSSPRKWIVPRRTRGRAVPVSVWLTCYALFASGIATCLILLREGLQGYGLGKFLANDSNPFINIALNLVSGVLLANSPQLLLSLCYLAYNSLFTRLEIAKEWASFSQEYNCLRVTEPEGQQYSTYRLQLPYKYSIPLMMVSVGLHWLVSNTIYVFISRGGYFIDLAGYGASDPSLPPNTTVTVGYSLTSLVVLIIVSSILVMIPPIFAFKKVSSHATQPGSNSLAISAACHSSNMSRGSIKPLVADEPATPQLEEMPASYMPVQTRSSIDLGTKSSDKRTSRGLNLWKQSSYSTLRSWFSDVNEKDTYDDDLCSPLKRLTLGKIRWGVIPMPAEWRERYNHDSSVEHLGFGSEEDNPTNPIPGNMYA